MKYEELEQKSIRYISRKWGYLGLPWYKDKDAIRRQMNDETKMTATVDDIERNLFPVCGRKSLDIGCGIGGLVVALKLKGAKAIGFDDDARTIEICRLRAKYYGLDNDFFMGDVLHIPFANDYFDVVTATGVLEHVKDREKAVREITRVAQNIYISLPNPSCPREGHYKIFWVPYMPKILARGYLKLRGFNPQFFERYVYYLSIPKAIKLLQRQGMVVENITKRDIYNKLSNPEQIESSNLKRKIAGIVKMMKLSTLIAKIYSYFPPRVVLVARKGRV